MRLVQAIAFSLLALSALVFAGLTGCGDGENGDRAEPWTPDLKGPTPAAPGDQVTSPTAATAPAAGKPLRIVYIPRALGNPVYKYARAAAEETAHDLNLNLQWMGPVNEDPKAQADLLRKLTAGGVDGIAISVSDPATARPAIDAAIEAGVAVVCWENDAPQSQRLAFYGINDYQSGVIAGRKVGELLGGRGKVAILSNAPNDAAHNQRVDGVRRGLSRYEEIQVAKLVYCNSQTATAIERMRAAVEAEPDIAGWVFTGAWPLLDPNGMDFLKADTTKIVAFESLPVCLDALRRGRVQALIGFRYFGWGREPLLMLARILQGGEPPRGPVDSGITLLTRENLDEYEEEFVQLAAREEPS